MVWFTYTFIGTQYDCGRKWYTVRNTANQQAWFLLLTLLFQASNIKSEIQMDLERHTFTIGKKC